MHELLVPPHLAGRRIQRDERVAIEVVAVPIGAVKIGSRAPERHERETALDIDRDEPPRVGAGAILICAFRPGLAARLPWPRYGMKCPQHLARPRIPPANVAV